MSIRHLKLMCLSVAIITMLSSAATSTKNVQVYNVKDNYGAKGDGSTPDDVAIQNAIDDAARNHLGNGAVIYFPKGDYVLNKPLHVGTGVSSSLNTDRISFEGESQYDVSLYPKGGSAIVFLGGDTITTDYQTWYNNSSKLNEIRNLRINKALTGSINGGCAIDLSHANWTIIENVGIFAFTNYSFDCGIKVLMDYATIRNCYISPSGGWITRGISLDVNTTRTFPSSQGNFYPGPVDGARIELNQITGCNIGIYANGQACNLIADNTLCDCLWSGIYIPNYSGAKNRIWGLTIRNNQMERDGNNSYNEIFLGRLSADVAKGIIIEGNFFNLEGKKDLNGKNRSSPYYIGDTAQVAQCTFNRNVYRNYDGIQVSEGLAVGVLPVTSTTASPMLSAGSFGLKATTVIGYNYTAGNEGIILVNTGTAIINLPAASTVSGRMYYIKKISAATGTITIVGNGSETIDGVATKQLTSQYQGMQIISNGTSWFIVSLK